MSKLVRLQSGLIMQLLMSLLWLSVSAGLFINDFNATHLFNPDWPPHARLHMMMLFMTTGAFTLLGLYLCWGPAESRLQSLRLSAVAGTLYMYGTVIAALTMPNYGGSMEWTDAAPRAATLANENFVVFIYVTIIFTALLIFMHVKHRKQS
jgi:hypothetical protein